MKIIELFFIHSYILFFLKKLFLTMKKRFSIFLLLATLSVWACKEDLKTANLDGHWEVIGGTFNGRPADQFKGFYLEFGKDGSLKTNLNVAATDEIGTFKVKNGKILKQTSEEATFSILEVKDTLLILATQMRGSDLQFVLHKK